MKNPSGTQRAAGTKAATPPQAAPRNESKQGPEWEKIFRSLKAWRKELQKPAAPLRESGGAFAGDQGKTVGDPSVSTVAEVFNQDPWAVLASTIISLRTKDEVTMLSSRALLAKAPGPRQLLALDENSIAGLIYPAGFYRTKAANLKKIAAILMDKYDGKVPSDMETLLALPGVGRKTANLVLTEAFNKEGLCVD
ncbi:MAG: hypothetical protein LBK64_07070, partial [Spirochaetaceae bacterium]|nr:hypothetical protein [Spirochaetaceae bacterium]